MVPQSRGSAYISTRYAPVQGRMEERAGGTWPARARDAEEDAPPAAVGGAWLQFACGPTSCASRRWVIDLRRRYNVTDTHLYLQVAIRLAMIMCKEHQAVMGNHIGFICMAREHHLATNGLLGSSNCYLFTILAEDELLCFTAHIAVRPEHERD